MAPGMKYRHYAPKAPVTAVRGEPAQSAQAILRRIRAGDGVICFREFAPLFQGYPIQTIGAVSDGAEQARRVFDALRWFDGIPVSRIWAMCPDDRGVGLAVSNRLKKAAGFHILDLGANPK